MSTGKEILQFGRRGGRRENLGKWGEGYVEGGHQRRARVSSCVEGELEARETALDLEIARRLIAHALNLVPEWNLCHEAGHLLSQPPSTPIYTDPATRWGGEISSVYRKNIAEREAKRGARLNPSKAQAMLIWLRYASPNQLQT